MKTLKLCFATATALCVGTLSANSALNYKPGDKLTDKQGVEYFKAISELPTQEWPTKELSINDVPKGKEGDMIRYAIELLSNTEGTLGPKGTIKKTNVDVNCMACHMDNNGNGLPGTKKNVLPFVNSVNNYPRLDIETMTVISLQDRVRGMGHTDSTKLPDDSKEMKAIMAYFKWLKDSYGIKDNVKLKGVGLAHMDFPNRPADPVKGKEIYQNQCASCHGERGEGVKNDNFAKGGGHLYPSLLIWPDGGHMSMIPVLSRFVYASMPVGATAEKPILTPGEALDVAAYVNTGFVRNPIHPTENRAGIDTAYSKSPSLKPEFFAAPQQQLDPKEYIKVKYGPWKNPNYEPGEK